MSAKKFKIKRFDQVLVTSGKYKGMTGQVQSVDRDNDRVYVSGVNLVKRHKKNERPTEKVASIHISNVSHFVEIEGVKKPSKVHIEIVDGKRKRVLAKTGNALPEHNYGKAAKSSEGAGIVASKKEGDKAATIVQTGKKAEKTKEIEAKAEHKVEKKETKAKAEPKTKEEKAKKAEPKKEAKAPAKKTTEKKPAEAKKPTAKKGKGEK